MSSFQNMISDDPEEADGDAGGDEDGATETRAVIQKKPTETRAATGAGRRRRRRWRDAAAAKTAVMRPRRRWVRSRKDLGRCCCRGIETWAMRQRGRWGRSRNDLERCCCQRRVQNGLAPESGHAYIKV